MSALSYPLRFVAFWAWFALEVLSSSWAVIRDVSTPAIRATPRVVRMPLDSEADWEVAMIGALITLTPGTLTLGVVEEPGAGRRDGPGRGASGRGALLVHSMYHHDTASAVADLRDMEARMLTGLNLHGAKGRGERR